MSLTPEEAAEQTAKDTESEFGVGTDVDGGVVKCDVSEDEHVSRYISGYADTTAERHDLDVEFRWIDDVFGRVFVVEYSDN